MGVGNPTLESNARHIGAFLDRKAAHRFYGGRDDSLRSVNL
jgi:hypothetical protein